VFLYGAGRAELVERAFRHPGKYVHHWVDPVVLVFGGHADHSETVLDELSREKLVHPVDLQHYVGQTHKLAHPIFRHVPRVLL